jgi:hypothetical protein
MANLTEVPGDDNIYQLESTDDIQGGAGGIANRQAQQLLDKIAYWRNRMLTGISRNTWAQITADLTLVNTDAGKMYNFTGPASVGNKATISLPVLNTMVNGDTFTFQNTHNPALSAGVPVGHGLYVSVGTDTMLDIDGGIIGSGGALYVGGGDLVVIRAQIPSGGGTQAWIVIIKSMTGKPGQMSLFPLVGGSLTLPIGWIPLNASIGITKDGYARLYALFGTTYGGTGSITVMPIAPDETKGSGGSAVTCRWCIKI